MKELYRMRADEFFCYDDRENCKRGYEELMKDYPKDSLQNWNRLRGQMPAWESLHRKYGN